MDIIMQRKNRNYMNGKWTIGKERGHFGLRFSIKAVNSFVQIKNSKI